MPDIQKVVLIGAGNLGTHVAQALFRNGINILEVYNRNSLKASLLSSKVESSAVNDLAQIRPDADLYILAVSDQAIEEAAVVLSKKDWETPPLVVHTSGATPGTILLPYFSRIGVFYPLQTFTVGRQPDFRSIPIGVDASNPADKRALLKLGGRISDQVQTIDDSQRAVLHLAAVFANNFTNQLYVIADRICQENGLSFDLLKPLIQETAAKITEIEPAKAQTGPAIRKDIPSIQKHLDFLLQYPEYRVLYQQFTRLIREEHK